MTKLVGLVGYYSFVGLGLHAVMASPESDKWIGYIVMGLYALIPVPLLMRNRGY